jgi:uncharacterized membrane protein
MGVLALISGAVSFYARKGELLHKKSGLLFCITMLTMSSSGAFLAALNGERLNILAGCLTFYLVASAYLVVHPFKRNDRSYTISLTVFGFIVGISGLIVCAGIFINGGGKIDGQSPQFLLVFSTIALLSSISDFRIIYSGRLKGKQKYIRHIWRMGFAMFMSTTSFFLGQSQVIPEEIRTIPVLVTPVLLVIVLTLYWVIRVNFWGSLKLPTPSPKSSYK